MKHLIVYQVKYKKVIVSSLLTFNILPQCQNKDAFIHKRFLLSINQLSVCSCSRVSSLKNSDNETY